MYKNLHGFHLCDRCQVIIEYSDNFKQRVLDAKSSKEFREKSPKVIKIQTRRSELHFCSDQCRIVHLRGRAYWNRKLQHMRANGVKNILLSMRTGGIVKS